jgi:uncharacterized protein
MEADGVDVFPGGGRTVLIMHVLLSGVVGSTAYGLAGPDSDVDRLGIFAAPTVAFHGLHRPDESHVTTKPDATFHECAKALRLILSSNPTATEVLWLPDDLYEVVTPLAEELIDIRTTLASAKRVRSAFLGYSDQQFRKLEARGDGSFSADTRKRTAKHARHLARLTRSGFLFYATGHLPVRLDDPQWYLDFGERVAAGDIDAARRVMADAEAAFDATSSALPAEPDERAAEAWLFRVRRAFLDVESPS